MWGNCSGRFEWLRSSGCDTKSTEGRSTGSMLSGRAGGCSQCTRTGGDAPRQLGWGSSAGTATATAQPSSAPTGTAPICHCASSSPSSPSPRAPREGRLCCASEAACAWAARVTRGAAVSSLCEGPLPLLSAEAVAKRRDLRIGVLLRAHGAVGEDTDPSNLDAAEGFRTLPSASYTSTWTSSVRIELASSSTTFCCRAVCCGTTGGSTARVDREHLNPSIASAN
mmetsp:Transcript_12258/g.28853  ORF Transcript_12258/g.28853 Transcript_12258/m.28853 type:complete len:225 (+) Transcript_12258:113-787(+)